MGYHSSKILIIGDSHSKPSVSNRRFDWLGKLIADEKPQLVVDLGDFGDMESLSSYDKGKKCVDRATEFLTLSGWKSIEAYQPGDFVAVYDGETRNIRFEQPKAFVKTEAAGFLRLATSQIDMAVTANHRLVYVDRNEKIQVEEAAAFVEAHEHLSGGHTGRFLTTFGYQSHGLGISEDMLRLLVAFKADGSQAGNVERRNRSSKYVHKFHFKRPDKIQRIKMLLDKSGLPYKQTAGVAGFQDFWTHIWGATKRYDFDYSRVSMRDAEIVIDEAMYWDGSKIGNKFSSIHKQDADFIQYCFALTGQRASVRLEDNSGGYNPNGTIYRVHGTAQTLPGVHAGSKAKVQVEQLASEDGFAYCFSTSTGMWLSRRNGHICVTGNSFEGRRYKKDVEAAIDARERINRGMKGMSKKPHLVALEGNHEDRIRRATESQPELDGVIHVSDLRHKELGWDFYPFLEPYRFAGFTFQHYFTTGILGKAQAGESPALNLIRKQIQSCVMGHTHLFDYAERRTSSGKSFQAFVAGCYLDALQWENYAGNTNRYWYKGILILESAKDGYSESFRRVGIGELEREYTK